MIPKITNENTLITNFFNTLVIQSQLSQDHVLNVNSPTGIDLSKLLLDNIYVSYLRTNSVILFEFLRNSDNNNMSYTKENDDINKYTSYKVHIIIYGNTSSELANKLKPRLLSGKVIDDLYNKGIYIKEIGEIETINEFINNKYWNRNDFDIYLACRYEYTQVSVENKTSENDKFEINTNNI